MARSCFQVPWRDARRLALILGVLGLSSALAGSVRAQGAPTDIGWKRTVIDPKFRSEGVALADVDRDGDTDVLVGDLWYEAPDWESHEVRPVGDFGDGAAGYSNAFLCFADDLNHDQWPDLIVIGFPGAPCHWYENPQGDDRHWPQHLIWQNACNESPQYVHLFQPDQRVLLMGGRAEGDASANQMAWFEPDEDPMLPWVMHAISRRGTPDSPAPGAQTFSHGLGIGDINGDGRNDVLCTEGWWEQPATLTDDPWPFHAGNLGEACSQMHLGDLNDDGVADVLSSSAHSYGIWAHEGRTTPDGELAFRTVPLFPKLLSETHALVYIDINGDGLKDLVTGKRWWAHGPNGDPGANEPAHLYWLEAARNDDGETSFSPRLIDGDSGVGLHVVVEDINDDGLLDVIASNKKGVFTFEQQRGGRGE